MKKNILRHLFARFASKHTWADSRMLYKQYLSYCKSAPDLDEQIWRLLKSNYDLRKKYGRQFKIVSLGWSCLPRTLATFTMLKAGKKAGEKSMPFDLAGNPPKSVAHFLHTDFSDYFSDKWLFDKANNWWMNDPATGVFYAHDMDCKENELEKIVARYRARIENFREALHFPGPVLFIMHKATHLRHVPLNHNAAEDFEEVAREIKRIRGDKPFKILCFACDHNEPATHIEGAEFIRLLWPDARYIWHLEERHTPEGVRFEMAFGEHCRNALLSMLKENNILKK